MCCSLAVIVQVCYLGPFVVYVLAAIAVFMWVFLFILEWDVSVFVLVLALDLRFFL